MQFSSVYLVPGSLCQGACLLADEHVKVKDHVRAQELPGQGLHPGVEQAGGPAPGQVQGGPHHLQLVYRQVCTA